MGLACVIALIQPWVLHACRADQSCVVRADFADHDVPACGLSWPSALYNKSDTLLPLGAAAAEAKMPCFGFLAGAPYSSSSSIVSVGVGQSEAKTRVIACIPCIGVRQSTLPSDKFQSQCKDSPAAINPAMLAVGLSSTEQFTRTS